MNAVIWRGSIGGALGAPVLMVSMILRDLLVKGHVPYGGALEILGLPPFLLFGVIVGTLIGTIFWVLQAQTGIKLPALIRAIIGMCFVLLVHQIVNTIMNGTDSGLAPPSPIEAFTNMTLYLGSFGALPGVIACCRIKKPQVRDS
jgi:hypothetical protein